MAEAKPDRRGYVTMHHPKTGAVQEFVPETVDAWIASGWKVGRPRMEAEKAEVFVPSEPTAAPAATNKEN